MNAYIDFQSFCSYLMSMNNKDFNKCNDVLLGGFNLYFTFEKEEIRTAKKSIRNNFALWSKHATTKRNGKTNSWGSVFPPRPICDNIQESFNKEQLTSIYMINGDGAEEWANMGCLLIASSGKELDLIKNLQIDGSFNITKQFRVREMGDWSIIGENSSPCTDIIIVDPYFFSQPDYEYKQNSYALLGQLCKWGRDMPINIVIFTNCSYECNNRHYDVPFNTIQRNLAEQLKASIGVKPNITFVVLPARAQHDRTILTNYKMYTSGNSFTYFRNERNTTTGEWMTISSLHDTDNLKNATSFLKELQHIVDDVRGGVNSIIGDKKSLFLNFNFESPLQI